MLLHTSEESLYLQDTRPIHSGKKNEESLLDKLRSVVATYTFRNIVRELQEGVDFTQHLYVPEVDPVTDCVWHDRADHNHLLKRIAQHVRDGGYDAFDYEAFSDVLADPLSGLTHTALVGKRRQSVKDAERLLSYHWQIHLKGMATMKKQAISELWHSGMSPQMVGVWTSHRDASSIIKCWTSSWKSGCLGIRNVMTFQPLT